MRSPEWMHLDFCLWSHIEKRLCKTAPSVDETGEAFLKRLRSIALRLPRQLVRSRLLSMQKRINMTAEAKAAHICIN